MKNLNPENFLDTQELSALENETVTGGSAAVDDVIVKKEKKKEFLNNSFKRGGHFSETPLFIF